MTDEFLIIDDAVEEIAVEEFSGVPTGTIITTTHGYGKGEQHPIEDITGLKTKLDNIESLKPVRSNLSGHADYYLWGETEDIGPGYFVRLGEDGMIHKCTNETIVIRPKDLPLETDENGNVVIYALAGNITTADINKYYVVGTQVPYDIYAYDGIEYVQKSSYSYDGEQVVKTCHTTDILGVTIDTAGFIGNDENVVNTYTSAKATDINYALVATTGVVDVLCGHDIVVGDYVFPTASGWAAKSTGSYGYLVTALVQNGIVVQEANKQEVLYARIVLQQSMVNAKKISDNVDYLLGETKRLDENIVTYGNTAETALKRAEELTEAAKNSADEAQKNSQNASDAAQNVQQYVGQIWDTTNDTYEIVQQAKKEAEEARTTALNIRNDAIEEAHKAAAEAAKNGGSELIKAVEYRLDAYTVGQYSQAYGLTWEQAKLIIPIGTVFIPMDEDPTATGAKTEYKEVYADTNGDIEQTFTVPYSYVWNGQGWSTGKTVLTTRTPTQQTEGVFWFVPKEYKGTIYTCGSLYRWEDGAWKEVAIRKENVMSRTMAHIYHDNDTIRASVNGLDGRVAAIESSVDADGARVGIVASMLTEKIESTTIGNYNAETETIDIIADEKALNDNWKDRATVGKYYVVGTQKPYKVYECTQGKSFKHRELFVYDGVDIYKINSSSIITDVNEGGSSISLNADRINFDGCTTFLRSDDLGANGSTIIDGGRIQTGTINANRIAVNGGSSLEEYLQGIETGASIITSVKTQYCLHTSSTQLPSNSSATWYDAPPSYIYGMYYWTRTYATYSNSDPTTSTPVYDDPMTKAAKSNLTIGELCIVEDKTYIDGAKIYTGSITADQIGANTITAKQLNADAIESPGYSYTSDNYYSSTGSKFDLNNGNIITPSFSVIDGVAHMPAACIDDQLVASQINTTGLNAEYIQSSNYKTNEIVKWSETSQDTEGSGDLEDTEGTEGLEFTLIDDIVYSVTKYNGAEANVIIPSKYLGQPVISIGGSAFYNCTSLTSIEIPSSVTSIGASAFANCTSLKSVVIPASVTTISYNAFFSCTSLESIIIPGGVTSIGSSAFYGCTKLTIYCEVASKPSGWGDNWNVSNRPVVWAYKKETEIDGITYYIQNGTAMVVKGQSNITSAKILSSITFEDNTYNTTSVGLGAFSGCSSLTNIEIPNSVTSIGLGAFNNCSSLTKVNYLGTIDNWAQISFPNHASNPLTNGADLYINDNLVTDAVLTTATKISNYAFWKCTSLTNVVIGNNVISIGESAFSGCSSLTNIVIPSSVTNIGNYAFLGCSKLTSAVIGNGVTSIGYDAFSNCSSLTIYCESEGQPSGWHVDWNSSNRPVYWYSETQPVTEGNYWYYKDGFKISGNDNYMIDSKYLKVTQNGQIEATEVDIAGALRAPTGRIGCLNITGENSVSVMDDKSTLYELTNKGIFLNSSNAPLRVGGLKIGYNEVPEYTHITSLTDPLYLEGPGYSGFMLGESSVSQDGVYLTVEHTKTESYYNNGYYNKQQITIAPRLSKALDENLSVTINIRYCAQKTNETYSEMKSDSLTVNIPAGQTQPTTDWTKMCQFSAERYKENSVIVMFQYESTDGSGTTFIEVPWTNNFKMCVQKPSGTSQKVITATGNIISAKKTTDTYYELGSSDAPWQCGYFLGTYNGGNGVCTISDANKKNSVELLPETYDTVFDNLKPVRFKFNEGSSDRYHTGFIAQELKQAIEDAGLTTQDMAAYVEYGDEDEQTCGIRYEEIIALNTDQIQKLKARVVEQDKVISDLTKRLEALEEKLK